MYTSGDFRQYDYGIDENLRVYNSTTPPQYEIGKIKTCVHMYYSDNDYMSAVEDVEYLATLLPCAELHHIPYTDWNHYDFLWSTNVKEVINDRIIERVQRYENTHDHFSMVQQLEATWRQLTHLMIVYNSFILANQRTCKGCTECIGCSRTLLLLVTEI